MSLKNRSKNSLTNLTKKRIYKKGQICEKTNRFFIIIWYKWVKYYAFLFNPSDIQRISSKKTPSTVALQSMETFPLEFLEDPPEIVIAHEDFFDEEWDNVKQNMIFLNEKKVRITNHN